MTKQDYIDALVNSDFHYIMHGDGAELLDSYLEYGFIGYSNMTLTELVAEYNQRKEIGTLKGIENA